MAGLLFLPGAAQPASAQDEGIKVHGNWVIEVRNPDGTLASQTEFKNALSDQGSLLPRMLAREPLVLRRWQINLSNYMAGPCGANFCTISEPGPNPRGTSPWSQNLTVARTGATVELAGSIELPPVSSSFVQQVWTYVETCSGSDAGATCNWSVFTRHGQTSGPPIVENLLPGQIIQVKVRITFS
ncbi:MAG: hypothetical protein Q8T13_01135 [Acidobacteriota bacterium]|nr:hypothetical protein [Acidobacteriota bacterium]